MKIFFLPRRQWKLQRERLQADFTKALDNFQRAQRSAAQKEKEAIKKYKNQGVSPQFSPDAQTGCEIEE